MAIVIKIDRNSIRRNPNAGNTTTYMMGLWEASFEIKGEIPDIIKKPPFYIKNWEEQNGIMIFAQGVINGPIDKSLIDSIPNLVVQMNRDVTKLEHSPESYYLWDYKKTYLKCKHCEHKVEVEEIEEDYIDDILIEICPFCGGQNTFPEHAYESIDNVIKE